MPLSHVDKLGNINAVLSLVLSLHINAYFRTYVRKNNENSLDNGKPVPQASFFSHFFENGHNGNFRVGIKIIDGADDVFRFEGGSCFAGGGGT